MLFSNINILCPDGTILKNGYLEVTGKKITYLGTTNPNCDAEECYDGTNKLLLPGFVNTHCHVPMTLLRSMGADLPLNRWLHEAIFPIESKLTEEHGYIGALLGIAEMLQSGVTSFTDMYFFGEARSKAVLESGIKANLSMGILCLDDSEVDAAPMVQETKDVFTAWHNTNDGQLKIDVGLHAEYTSNPKIVRGVSEYAQSIGANMHIHLAETKEETEGCIARHQKTPAAYFRDMGTFENNTTAAHCIYMTDEDLDILANYHVTVSHCPISNLKLGSGIADVIKMQNHGVAVSIGTDGPASNDNLNFIEDMKLAPLLQKGFHRNPSLLSSGEVLKMATHNGAVAQGRRDTGEIKVGNRADLVVIDYNSINLQPETDLATALIYAALPSNVKMTMVDGKVLYRDGVFLTIDSEKILYEAARLGKKLYKM